ncbi:MAG: HEAT repeat domain-containing protein [Actinobacteria bacterium]|nr:HEAT repeat domain-containing protein [Actinomycetota bacterium]
MAATEASDRLQAALTAGTAADPAFLEPLLERCAVEPDFFVRDMLTWALCALPREITVPRLLAELGSDTAQARSQALHTLSKVGDPGTRSAVLPAHLHDPDPEVSRAAWRTAVGLAVAAPASDSELSALAAELAPELGRGDLELQRSLSRAFVELGDAARGPVNGATLAEDAAVRMHAKATLRLLDDPEAGFYLDPKD